MMRARMYRPSDEADLVRLASAAMPGWARLRYDYAPGYAAAEALKGACEIVVVEDEEGCMAGCGTRATRRLYLDGAPQDVGYLSAFTTILDDNAEARELLTSGRAGLPKYSPRGRVVTYALAPRGGAEPERASFDELEEFYARVSPRKQLFPVFGKALPPGLSADDFFVVRRGGRVAAAGAVWNHGERRRIFVDGYMLRLRVLRPFLNVLFRFSSCPMLPSPGSEFACSYLAYALAENDDPSLFAVLVEAARRICRGRNLVLSLHSHDPLTRVAAKFGGWRYRSDFLTVEFAGRPRNLRGIPYIEAGAL